LLDQLCHSYEDVYKEAIIWLFYAEDEVSTVYFFFIHHTHTASAQVQHHVTLLRSGLVNISLQDQQLVKNLFTDPRPSLRNFAACLIRECLSSDPPVVSQSQLTYSIEALEHLAQAGKLNEEYVAIKCNELLICRAHLFLWIFSLFSNPTHCIVTTFHRFQVLNKV